MYNRERDTTEQKQQQKSSRFAFRGLEKRRKLYCAGFLDHIGIRWNRHNSIAEDAKRLGKLSTTFITIVVL